MRPPPTLLAILGALACCGPESTGSSATDATQTTLDTTHTPTTETTTAGPETTEAETTGSESGSDSDTDTDTDTDTEGSLEACSCAPPVCENGGAPGCEWEGSPGTCLPSKLAFHLNSCPFEQPCETLTETCSEDSCYNDGAVACALNQLRDRTPGVIIWDSTFSGGFDGEYGLIRVMEGDSALVHGCTYADFSTNFATPSWATLESPEYFDGCLAMPGTAERWTCLHAGVLPGQEVASCPAE